MIDIYTWPTTNGHKIHIMLEETATPYKVHAINIRGYSKEKRDYPIERYTNESHRLTNVLDRRLAEARYLAGDQYSIADMAVFPWMRNSDRRGVNLAEYPNVTRWFDAINARPAV